MPSSKQSRSQTARKTKTTELAIAIDPKSELEIMFDRITEVMVDDFQRIEDSTNETFKLTEAEMLEGFDKALSATVLPERLQAELDTAFDRIEHEANMLVAKLQGERDDGNDATIQAAVAFAKELSATETAVEELWRETYELAVRSTEAQSRVAAVYAAMNIS